MREIVDAYLPERSALMSALADAAPDDPRVETAYFELVQTFIDATAAHIRGRSIGASSRNSTPSRPPPR